MRPTGAPASPLMIDSPPLRVAVAEDEPLTRAQLVQYLREYPAVEVVGEATSGREAVDLVRHARPDLLLLDVQMPEMTGLEALDRLVDEGHPLPAVVFVTAFDHHAVRAFELHALDYVVKPFDGERLEQAVERARNRIKTGHMARFGNRMAGLLQDHGVGADALGDLALGTPYTDRLAVRTGGRVDFVRVDDVDWIEGSGVYARLHVGDKTYLLREALTRLEEQLPPRRFVRIHRSAIVNLDRVRSLDHLARGEYVVYLHDGTQLKLSRSYRDRLQDLLGADAA